MAKKLLYFPSKRDTWLWLIIWTVILIPQVILIQHGVYSHLLIFLPIALFVSWIWFGTGYTITENELWIKSGTFKYKIPIENLIKIRKTRNPLSSLALSLDRLEIKYGVNFAIRHRGFC